jgi:ribosomal protein S18 acetylase RimI-like enzyme
MKKVENSYYMFNVKNEDIFAVADCFIASFPHSFAAKLGKKYVQKTMEWFLVCDDCSLYWIKNEDERCIGFVGAKLGYGSTSGMIQHAFWQGIIAALLRPWLLFTSEVRGQFSLILSNIRHRIFGRKAQKKDYVIKQENLVPSVGLVVIGVSPEFQGKGYGRQLLSLFDEIVCKFGSNKAHLSVKIHNNPAIATYQKSGWKISSEGDKTYRMTKKYFCIKDEIV